MDGLSQGAVLAVSALAMLPALGLLKGISPVLSPELLKVLAEMDGIFLLNLQKEWDMNYIICLMFLLLLGHKPLHLNVYLGKANYVIILFYLLQL